MRCCNNSVLQWEFQKRLENFLQAERLDLHVTGLNNATNAFKQMGLYPYNPNCESWSGAIDTLGLANNDSKGKVQYEIYPMLPQKQLTDNEKKILRDGLNVNPENEITGITGDVGVAFT